MKAFDNVGPVMDLGERVVLEENRSFSINLREYEDM